ncbi:ABC transporter permease [Limnochorda pilosa]|nr:ABC transporter permease [Limnochorda pilosa]
MGWVAPLYLPAPSAIAAELVRMAQTGTLVQSLGASLMRIVWGFALGAAAGIVVGLAIGLSRVAEGALDPAISLLYPIPKIAVLPLFVLWLGIGEASKVAIIATGVFFPLAINTIAGVRQTSPILVRAAISLGASRRQVITKVVLPSALPVVFSGLRLGAGMALLLVVSAEMVAATSGLGFLVLNAGDLMLTTRLMAGIVVLSALGILSTWLLRQLERWLLPWNRP